MNHPNKILDIPITIEAEEFVCHDCRFCDWDSEGAFAYCILFEKYLPLLPNSMDWERCNECLDGEKK